MNETSKWKWHSFNIGFGFPDLYRYYELIGTGDTTIMGKEYYKFLHEYTLFNHSPFTGDTTNYTTSQWEMFYREEGKEIFSYYNNEEHLLYNFDLEIGDTIYFDSVFYFEAYIINDISNFEFAGQTRNQFHINTSSGELLLYEGIGSTRGFLSPFEFVFEGNRYLDCYEFQEEYFMPNSQGDCDIQIVLSDNTINDFEYFQLFPNPASNIIQFKINLNAEYKKLAIFNSEGKKVSHSKFVIGRFGNLIQLEISELEVGIYFIKLEVERNIFHSKFIKI
jgi:hypothetical protein